ncbi:MAG: hypothetical protein IKE91_06175 [Clostridia bacterium]|nr:hypothetical protein [bacterium]MBR2705035.1 hypothetical protein [Clostridia bacterium]
MEKTKIYTDELNIEIFELEQKVKKLEQEINKTKMYIGMYYKKVKELEKIRRMLKGLYENSNDHVRYEIDKILDEMNGVRKR